MLASRSFSLEKAQLAVSSLHDAKLTGFSGCCCRPYRHESGVNILIRDEHRTLMKRSEQLGDFPMFSSKTFEPDELTFWRGHRSYVNIV